MGNLFRTAAPALSMGIAGCKELWPTSYTSERRISELGSFEIVSLRAAIFAWQLLSCTRLVQGLALRTSSCCKMLLLLLLLFLLLPLLPLRLLDEQHETLPFDVKAVPKTKIQGPTFVIEEVVPLSLVSMFQNCAVLQCSLWLFRSWGKSFSPVPAGTRSKTRPRRLRAGF